MPCCPPTPPNLDAPELVPPDSLTAEHTGRWTFLVLEGAAFMMQAMHPVIAEVAGRYSAAFHGDQAGRAIRSIDSVVRWTYGRTEAVAEGNRVRAMHQPLTMNQWVIATGYIVNAKPARF